MHMCLLMGTHTHFYSGHHEYIKAIKGEDFGEYIIAKSMGIGRGLWYLALKKTFVQMTSGRITFAQHLGSAFNIKAHTDVASCAMLLQGCLLAKAEPP